MANRQIYLEYREAGDLLDAYSVTLTSADNSYGIRKVSDNSILVPSGTLTDRQSTGIYAYNGDFSPNVVYEVSWAVKVNGNDVPRYFVDQIGPFPDRSTIRAVADKRGTFAQRTKAVLFLRVGDMDGKAVDPSSISYSIEDCNFFPVMSGIPEKADLGFYAIDWLVPEDITPGRYNVIWFYTVDGEAKEILQEIEVAARQQNPIFVGLYHPRIQELRMALSYMLGPVQCIPVRREPAKPSRDLQTYKFTFPRWDSVPGVKVFRNDVEINDGFGIDWFNGTVTFDIPQTSYDRIDASYNFKWFRDDEIDRFLSNSISILNIWPASSRWTLLSIDDKYIPVVLYGGAVDAIRSLMLSLQFQEPQLVFGGAEASKSVYSNLSDLKKNYEETWNKALEQKKNAPYRGLTKLIVTPEFALPGGRSRWFRYMFSNGS